MTSGQLTIFRNAIAGMKNVQDNRGYNYFASVHGLPMPLECDIAHGQPYFLPWHRAYLYFFERALRDQGPEAMLTWWDWTGAQTLPLAFTVEQADGQPNTLLSAQVDPLAIEQAGGTVAAVTERKPGGGTLPTRRQVDFALGAREFTEFSTRVENLHNGVHNWVGGHMSMPAFSSFDPIFWAHHTMIDRLWWVWQLRHPGALPPATILDEALPPFRMTVRQTLDITVLGYDYAVSTTSAVVVTQ